ncbi:MAG: DUF996 domain-containing protein [candidate division WOR-3 bacterium]
MKIKDIKVIGAIGLMLNLLGIIPRLGFVARITGLILILVALKEISNVLGEQDIFKKYLAGFLINLIGSLALLGLSFILGVGTFLISILQTGGIFELIRNLGPIIIFLLLSFYAVLVISSYFYRESFNLLSQKTNERLFATAANLIFYGAILTIILVGALVSLAGQIVAVVAFLSLPNEITTQPTDLSSSVK